MWRPFPADGAYVAPGAGLPAGQVVQVTISSPDMVKETHRLRGRVGHKP